MTDFAETMIGESSGTTA